MATQDAKDETMADEIEKLQQLRRTLDESEEAIGRLLYSATTWRSERDGQRKRADAMEKRAKDVELERDAAIKEAVLAKGALADGASEAAAARIRAGVAEAQVAERNAEIDRLKREAASLPDRIQEYEVAFAAINRELGGSDTRLHADKVVAKIRALKDQRDDSEANYMTAQGEQEGLEREVASLRAQVATLTEERDDLANEDEIAHKQLGAIAEILGCPGGTYSAMVETARGLRAQVESLRGARTRDALHSLCVEASKRHGDPGGTFNLANLGNALADRAGTHDGVDGRILRVLLAGRPDIEPLSPGDAHFRIIGESLRGQDGSAWSVSEQRKRASWRSAAFMEILASLTPPSSPKTGRWKCIRCGRHLRAACMPDVHELVNASGRWAWGVEFARWYHFCDDARTGYTAERIGDAPEVTP